MTTTQFLQIHQIRIWLLAILSFLWISCLAQNETYFFHRLTVADNLTSQNINYYIYKDTKGFVWISSTEGLNRYDGAIIKQYHPNPNNPNSLADPNITSPFFEDPKGHIWFSTVEAIHKYDRKNGDFKKHYLEQETEAAYYLLHFDTATKTVWLRVDQTIFLCKLNNLLKPIFRESFPLNFKSKIIKRKPDTYWLLTIPKEGISLYDIQNTSKKNQPKQFLKHTKVRAFHYQNGKNLWVGTDKGLFWLNIENGNSQLLDKSLKDINDIIMLNEKQLLIATQSTGLYFFNIDTGTISGKLLLQNENGVSSFNVPIDKIYLDRDQTLWVSTIGSGVYFTNFKKKKFKAFLQQNELVRRSNSVKSIAEDQEGKLWCLTESDIVIINFNANEISNQIIPIENTLLSSNYISSISSDLNNRIWGATSGGLFMKEEPNLPFVQIPVIKPFDTLNYVFRHLRATSFGKTLVSTQRGILEIVEQENTGILKVVPQVEDLQGKDFSWIHEFRKNEQIILRRIENSFIIGHFEAHQFQIDTILPFKPFLNYFIEDINHELFWIASSQGLHKMTFKNGTYNIQRDTIFPFQTLNGILQDDASGNLWIGTNRGLVKYDPAKIEWHFFSVSDGLQGYEFNYWSALKTSKGQLAFGGINGLNVFEPSAIKTLENKVKPIITNLLIYDEPAPKLLCKVTGFPNISEIKKLVFPYSQNTLTFFFAALEYSDPEANQFKFWMEGLDENWVNNGTKNSIRYPNLREGVYTFKVDATNSDGVWSKSPTELAITILPPWYRTWWFYSLVSLAIITILYTYYRFRIAQIRKEETFKRKEAEFRQKEAEYKQLAAETETAVLRLQMNPHFIFNSMNSISSYILQKDIETANDYLLRFAKLMRMILKFAEKPLITVSEEIELLEQYLKTEAMRFERKFDFAFELGDKLDPDEFVLPTMILQPFVENAIWHGLSNKKGKGRIIIKFEIIKNQLHCIVEDNGVGRKKAVLQKPSYKEHESKALSITQRRLELLAQKSNQPASFEMQDLYDKNSDSSGTRVILKMPVL